MYIYILYPIYYLLFTIYYILHTIYYIILYTIYHVPYTIYGGAQVLFGLLWRGDQGHRLVSCTPPPREMEEGREEAFASRRRLAPTGPAACRRPLAMRAWSAILEGYIPYPLQMRIGVRGLLWSRRDAL